jgi:Domain of unknown function (DUF4032)
MDMPVNAGPVEEPADLPEGDVATSGGAAAEQLGATALRAVQVPRNDWARLQTLPWGAPLEDWPHHGVTTLTIRRGESRHPVLFVEAGHRRYALKETSPRAAEHEIGILEELRRRRCHTLEPVGHVVVRGETIEAGEVAGRMQYMSGDVGYCVTRLAEHVLPQSLLYRYPFTDANKRLLWSAVAELLLDLHEAGVFWGDPSLANVLMDLRGQRLTAVMADAETAELVQGPLDEGLRKQDVESFVESLEWQAEDIRLARGLPEDQRLVTEGDAAFFSARYAGLRAERSRRGRPGADAFAHALDLHNQMRRLNALGYGMLNLGTRAIEAGRARVESAVALPATEPGWSAATLRPGWYVQRLRELLGVQVPPAYARRLYQHILVDKWLLSERAGHDVGIEAAARDFYARYHRPALDFVSAYLPKVDTATTYATYLAVLDHTWQMSQQEHRAVPLEEGAVDYALRRAPAGPVESEE